MHIQYVARQPILDSQRQLTGYELLFRDSTENRCPQDDLDMASKRTADTAMLMGLDVLSSGHDLFFNCNAEFLTGKFPTLFPAKFTVVEVLESVEPSEAVLTACIELKSLGYRIALDDFVERPHLGPLVDLADIIKIDLRTNPLGDCKSLVAACLRQRRTMLAEKVETKEEFETAVAMGFTLFQGYFFSKPVVLSTSAIGSLGPTQARIFDALSRQRLDYVQVEEIVKTDPALCYRFLRYLNSPSFYLQSELRSILHGLVLLGEEEARKWLLLVGAVLSAMKPEKMHLLETALVRARYAELIASRSRLPGSPAFVLGLLSMLDAILDMRSSDLADQLAVSEEIRNALLGKPTPLRKCLDLVSSYESADWKQCETLRRHFNLSSQHLSESYLEAVRWSRTLIKNVPQR